MRQLWSLPQLRSGGLAQAKRGARAAVVAAAATSADTAFGRAGGGAHSAASHGASHSSTSYGLGGGGGLSLGGLVALIIIGLILWYILRRMRSSPAMTNFGAGPAPASPAAQLALSALGASLGSPLSTTARGALAGARIARPSLPPAVDAIRNLDPGFEMETFLQRAEMAFFLVKRGIQRNDPASIRPYLDDAVFAQVSRYIGQMKQQHVHALLESLNVRSVHLEQAECNDQGQTLMVHFDLVYRSKTLDDANRVMGDEGEDRPHGERWTFVRAATARTPVSGGVTASRCPACGAELRLNLDGTCAHCRVSVTNGSVDWVVADVQPAPFVGYAADSQLAVAAPSVQEGIAALRAADPGFSVDAFAARARQAFLALQAAWCNQNLEGGRAFLSPGAYFAWSAQLETLAAEGRRNIMENVDVRGVQPLRVVHGRVFDDLTVRIAAVAADFEIDKDNRMVFGDRIVRPFTEEWTFQRSIGVATLGKPGTLESTCPRCGAPLSLTQIGECRYCKAAVTSGKFDWVVSRIEQEDGDSAAGPADPAGSIGTAIAAQVGGAIVGGLLGSLLSGNSSKDSDDRDW